MGRTGSTNGRTVSWRLAIPRSNVKSSTFRRDSGKRARVSTTRRIAAGDELMLWDSLVRLRALA